MLIVIIFFTIFNTITHIDPTEVIFAEAKFEIRSIIEAKPNLKSKLTLQLRTGTDQGVTHVERSGA